MDLRLDDLPVHVQMKVLRIVAGISAKGMAARWGVSEAYIYRVERGDSLPKPLELKDAIEAAGFAIRRAADDPQTAETAVPPLSRRTRTA